MSACLFHPLELLFCALWANRLGQRWKKSGQMILPGHLGPSYPRVRSCGWTKPTEKFNCVPMELKFFFVVLKFVNLVVPRCLSGSNWTPLFHANSPFCIWSGKAAVPKTTHLWVKLWQHALWRYRPPIWACSDSWLLCHFIPYINDKLAARKSNMNILSNVLVKHNGEGFWKLQKQWKSFVLSTKEAAGDRSGGRLSDCDRGALKPRRAHSESFRDLIVSFTVLPEGEQGDVIVNWNKSWYQLRDNARYLFNSLQILLQCNICPYNGDSLRPLVVAKEAGIRSQINSRFNSNPNHQS